MSDTSANTVVPELALGTTPTVQNVDSELPTNAEVAPDSFVQDQENSGWEVIPCRPKSPEHHDYTGTVSFYSAVYSFDSELQYQDNVRWRVLKRSLPTYYNLRKHAIPALAFLTRDPPLVSNLDKSTLPTPELTALEVDQNAAAYHHIAIHETLRIVEESAGYEEKFGLPCRSEFRLDRNHFAHIYCTPARFAHNSEDLFKSHEKNYRKLLQVVEANIPLIEQQLEDLSIWSPRPPNPPPSPPHWGYTAPEQPTEVPQPEFAREPMEYSSQGPADPFQDPEPHPENIYALGPVCQHLSKPLGFCMRSHILRDMLQGVENYLWHMREEAQARDPIIPSASEPSQVEEQANSPDLEQETEVESDEHPELEPSGAAGPSVQAEEVV